MTALVADLLPWLVGFYLFDAAVQLRRGQVVLEREGLAPFRTLGPGVHLAAPTPLGVALFAYALPYLPARDGLWVFDPDARGAPPVVRPNALTLVPWPELGELRAEGTKVMGGARVLFRVRSPRAARLLAAELTKLRAAAPERFADELAAQLAARFDLSAVRARWKRARVAAALAAFFGMIEALLLFGALPLLAFTSWASAPRWAAAGIALGVAHLGAVAFGALTAARTGARFADGVSTVAPLVFFPHYAARARPQALRDAFIDFEPCALAAALMPPDEFSRIARREWFSMKESATATEALGLGAYWSARRHAFEALLTELGTNADALLAPPPLAAEAAAWCALCLGEYRSGYSHCSDCGLALIEADVERHAA